MCLLIISSKLVDEFRSCSYSNSTNSRRKGQIDFFEGKQFTRGGFEIQGQRSLILFVSAAKKIAIIAGVRYTCARTYIYIYIKSSRVSMDLRRWSRPRSIWNSRCWLCRNSCTCGTTSCAWRCRRGSCWPPGRTTGGRPPRGQRSRPRAAWSPATFE